jgi:Leucine-rich repeat (LRR) protein
LQRVYFTNGEFPEICLPKLTTMSVRHSNLEIIPDLTNYKKLKTLYIQHCLVKTIPDHLIKMFVQLETVSISEDFLTKIVKPVQRINGHVDPAAPKFYLENM